PLRRCRPGDFERAKIPATHRPPRTRFRRWLARTRLPKARRPIRRSCPMLRWFHALMPKEERFFELFARHSEAVLGGARALRAMLEGSDAIAQNYQIVMDREQDADDVTREVLIAVRRTFITPFDRGNIRDLITSMDNSIDQMQKTAKGIKLFDVSEFTAEMKEMADAIVKCAELVKQAVPMLQALQTLLFQDRATTEQ